MKYTLRSIELEIERAWRDTGREFIALPHPKCVFWTEQAALHFPFYSNLLKHLHRSRISQSIAVVPEYNPGAPGRAMCGEKSCPCHANKPKKQMRIDLCLVEFGKEIEYEAAKCRDVWCFNPKPIIAMEFKYPGAIDKWTFDEDIKKLLTMHDDYRVQLLYLCFAADDDEAADIRTVRRCIEKNVRSRRSAMAAFRLAVGTVDKKEWSIQPLS